MTRRYDPGIDRSQHSGARVAWIAVGAVLVIRIGLALAAWEPGWSALKADDFSRVQIAREWAASPALTHDLVWLPLPTWINGLGFAVFGNAVSGNPMLLTAIVNTIAVIAAAGIAGWTGWRLFESRTGALIAFGAVLFAPWGFHVSLSGLSEPVYYVAVAATVGATIEWLRGRRLRWLIAAAAALAAAGLCRYEGWTLATAWAIVVAYLLVFEGGSGGLLSRIKRSRLALLVLGIPFLVPLGWMALNWQRTGDPLFFVGASQAYFDAAYGGAAGIVYRLVDFPLGLWRSAPLILAATGIAVLAHRRNPAIRALVAIIAITWGLLYLSSIVSPVGIFPERFLFAFPLALAPALAGLPEVLRRLRSGPVRVTVAIGALGLAIAVAAVGILDRPRLWAAPPDFLTLADRLGDIGSTRDPVHVVVGEGMPYEPVELQAWHGDRVRVTVDSGVGIPPDGDVRIEHLPERITMQPEAPGTVIGTYAVFGPAAPLLRDEPCAGCEGWMSRDEGGVVSAVAPGSYIAVRFTGDDPDPGDEAVISKEIGAAAHEREGWIRLRWLYGTVGLNAGRIRVEVRVDGQTLWSEDVAAPRRWVRIPITVPPPGATIEVVVVAQPGIEKGWAWGRASAVLIGGLVVEAP